MINKQAVFQRGKINTKLWYKLEFSEQPYKVTVFTATSSIARLIIVLML
jgi:hypothetical protein